MTTETTGTPAAQETTTTANDFYKEVDTTGTPDQVIPDSEKAAGTLATGEVPAGDKPADAAAAAPVTKPDESKGTEGQPAPEIKLTAPENYLLDKSRVDDVIAFAKENGLTQESAEKLLNRENELVAKHILAEDAAHKAEVTGWLNTVTSDKELGGEKLKETAQYSYATLKQFGSESLIQELNETGYGNHPEVVRLLSRIGKAMGPDILVRAGLTEQSKKTVDTADLFYGNTKPQE